MDKRIAAELQKVEAELETALRHLDTGARGEAVKALSVAKALLRGLHDHAKPASKG